MDQGSWVSVTFTAGPWEPALERAVLADLQAGLWRRGLAACRAPEVPNNAALAVISLALAARESVTVTVEIRDALTNKRVMRDLDLAPIPPDGRALALALAADELVWASWAELALREHTRQREAPRPVVAELDRQLAPPMARRSRVGVGLGLERYAGKLTLIGADATYGPRLGERIMADLGLGIRQGLESEAPDGRITAMAVALEAGIRAIVFRSRRLELAVTGSERTSYVRFHARANPMATASSITGLALFARAGVQATIVVASPVWVGIGIGAGLPLRAVEATDQGQTVVGMSGLEGSAQLRIGVSL